MPGQTGGSVIKKLKSAFVAAHKYVKDNQAISRGLNHFGYKKLGAAAGALGYGRRRRRRVRRV